MPLPQDSRMIRGVGHTTARGAEGRGSPPPQLRTGEGLRTLRTGEGRGSPPPQPGGSPAKCGSPAKGKRGFGVGRRSRATDGGDGGGCGGGGGGSAAERMGGPVDEATEEEWERQEKEEALREEAQQLSKVSRKLDRYPCCFTRMQTHTRRSSSRR